MAKRAEFTKATKRDALKRSAGLCEAIGALYGLPDGKRCNAPLSAGVEFDHIDLDANSKDNSLSNCAAVCRRCHSWKTRFHDTPKAAKTLRQQDKHAGITKPKGTMRGRPRPEPTKAPKIDKLPMPERRHLFKEREPNGL
ncbi:MAG: HNH endonuclease [Patescibacteria group bacterium]|nr:HNH endonuclease [Patescibacteria group bacterium]